MFETKYTEKSPFLTANKDDYDWLRDRNWPEVTDPKVLKYLEQENTYTEKNLFIKYKKEREQILKELQEYNKFAHVSEYTKKDNYYYYTKTEDNKNYKIYCRRINGENQKEEIIFDENIIAENKKFMRVGAFSISDDHNFLVYAVDFVGDEQFTIKVIDLNTKQHLSDEIPSVSFANLTDIAVIIPWHKNSTGFFYTPTSDRLFPEKVMFHKLGNNYKEDELVSFEKDPEYSVFAARSQSKRFLFINTFSGSFNKIHAHINNILGKANEIYYIDFNENKSLKPLLFKERKEGVLYTVEHSGNDFYVRVNDVNTNFRLIKTNINNRQEKNWQEITYTGENQYLESFDVSADFVVLNYKQQGLTNIEVLNIKTNNKKTITFPAIPCAATGYIADFEEDDLRIYYSSLKEPDRIYKYKFSSAALTVLKQQDEPIGFVANDYVVESQFADNNGVTIPITIFYKKSLFKKDGANPLYLYGYGAYGSSVSRQFRAELLPLVNKGIVFAIAHVRGGDELGMNWYLDGKLLKKKNTFEDFIACSEYLIKEKYTSKGNIAISGISAGGTLIGYVINTRPELYKAAILHQPFVDVLNTLLDETIPLTNIEFQEWGDPKNAEFFAYIKSYSPYDNIKKQDYPNILVTASINDPRVCYWEPAKFVAKLNTYKMNNNDLFFKVMTNISHLGGSGMLNKLQEIAEDYTFIYKSFGMLE